MTFENLWQKELTRALKERDDNIARALKRAEDESARADKGRNIYVIRNIKRTCDM